MSRLRTLRGPTDPRRHNLHREDAGAKIVSALQSSPAHEIVAIASRRANAAEAASAAFRRGRPDAHALDDAVMNMRTMDAAQASASSGRIETV